MVWHFYGTLLADEHCDDRVVFWSSGLFNLPPAPPPKQVVPITLRALVAVLLARFQVPTVNITLLALAAFAAFSP